MNFNYLNLSIDGSGIGTITLNRPKTHNAFDEVMINELIFAIESLNRLDKISVILLTAEGKNFSSGADLKWMQRMINFDHAENIADATLLAKLMQTLYFSSKTTIALVQGSTYGGGIGFVACCDIAIASTEACFCFSEVKLGLTPSIISPYVTRAIGIRQAKRYFLTAEIMDAPTALTLGLIHEIVEQPQLFARGYTLATQLLQHGPEALKATKELLLSTADHDIDAKLIERTVETIAKLRVSDEAQNRLQAFLAKNR
jgi:methylglutaconyl-CoA hydratase